jgi:hypothetical protein
MVDWRASGGAGRLDNLLSTFAVVSADARVVSERTSVGMLWSKRYLWRSGAGWDAFVI